VNGRYLHIERDDGDQVRSRSFIVSKTFPNREEAIQYCFAFGQQSIDGKVAHCSVADL
jgi:hypothetical protein